MGMIEADTILISRNAYCDGSRCVIFSITLCLADFSSLYVVYNWNKRKGITR